MAPPRETACYLFRRMFGCGAALNGIFDEGLIFRAVKRVEVGRIGVIMPRRAALEAFAIFIAGVVIWLAAIYFDAMDALVGAMEEHEVLGA